MSELRGDWHWENKEGETRVSEKRLSEIMSDKIDIIGEAQETLDNAITQAINTHFEAGIQFAEERIIKLLEPEVARHYELGLDASAAYLEQLIALIKGEQK